MAMRMFTELDEFNEFNNIFKKGNLDYCTAEKESLYISFKYPCVYACNQLAWNASMQIHFLQTAIKPRSWTLLIFHQLLSDGATV